MVYFMKFIIVILIWLIADSILHGAHIMKLYDRIKILESEIDSIKGYYFSFNTDKE